MIELKKLNVHRIVATEEEKSVLISQGYEVVEEVANEVFKEVEEVKKGKE
jgi:ribosomal protein S19E (S16A)